jgi:hypothetical protein
LRDTTVIERGVDQTPLAHRYMQAVQRFIHQNGGDEDDAPFFPVLSRTRRILAI